MNRKQRTHHQRRLASFTCGSVASVALLSGVLWVFAGAEPARLPGRPERGPAQPCPAADPVRCDADAARADGPLEAPDLAH